MKVSDLPRHNQDPALCRQETPAVRRVLMVAFHFPPQTGSSGIQRTLRFVQYLPGFGWEPLVLTVNPRAYERTSDDLVSPVPQGTVVRRAFALDTARHLAIAGRYLSRLASPDRWCSWRFDGVRVGMEMIRRYRPDVIWSTYPIATAHLIAAELQRRSGLPWIADFRDPMLESDPSLAFFDQAPYAAIEADAVHRAKMCMFTTPGAANVYKARYPDRAERMVIVENGYDEEAFAEAERRVLEAPPAPNGPRVLLHSGVIYPRIRDPGQLFAALRRLHDEGSIRPGQLLVRMRAAVHDELVRSLAATHGVSAYVEVAPPVGYVDALVEMLTVDGLLLLQDSCCNQQVPAKLYEYLRAGRPILTLSDPAGDTASILRDAGIPQVARLNDASEIAALLRQYLQRDDQTLKPSQAAMLRASRRERTGQLRGFLERFVPRGAG